VTLFNGGKMFCHWEGYYHYKNHFFKIENLVKKNPKWFIRPYVQVDQSAILDPIVLIKFFWLVFLPCFLLGFLNIESP
jgi:hypothetical protein